MEKWILVCFSPPYIPINSGTSFDLPLNYDPDLCYLISCKTLRCVGFVCLERRSGGDVWAWQHFLQIHC